MFLHNFSNVNSKILRILMDIYFFEIFLLHEKIRDSRVIYIAQRALVQT